MTRVVTGHGGQGVDMFHRDTVLILGAGASVPYKFPSGEALVNNILDIVPGRGNGDKQLQTLAHLGVGQGVFSEFQRELKQSMHLSIDAFLERRPKYLKAGKVAIAQQLLPCEVNDWLFTPCTENSTRNWYRMLLHKLTSGTRDLSDFASNKVTIVTFNYDRSLEHFLFTTLHSHYETTEDTVAEVLNKMDFIHVHGRLGLLPWQDGNGERIEYGASYPDAIERAANEIKIIFEITPDTMHDFMKAHRPINEASEIFFLGFGYHPNNVERLQVPFQDIDGGWPDNRSRYICGTAFGLSEEEKRNISQNRCQRINLGESHYTIDAFLKNCFRFLSDK